MDELKGTKQRRSKPLVGAVAPRELAVYRAMAQHRWKRERQRAEERRERAWEVAREAAQMLKEQFGAKRVVVFGSLVHKGCFTQWSDADLAAWGLRPEATFRAMGAVMDLDAEIEVNLVDVAVCRPSLRAVIEREGIEV
jgi:predicted nucleotidyltransferase